MFDKIVKAINAAVLVASLFAAGSTVFTYIRSADAVSAMSRTSLNSRTAAEIADVLPSLGIGCADRRVFSHTAIADSQAICVHRGSPLRVYAFKGSGTLADALARKSIADSCGRGKVRYYVIDNLVIFRTQTRWLADRINRAVDGIRFDLTCT